MNVCDIIDGINARKSAVGMTNQQIADASGVPKSTVDRVLSKRTENPTMQVILDIAGAVGYNMGGSPKLPATDADHDSQYVRHIITMYESQIAAQERQYNRITAEKDRWIRTLAAIIAVMGTGIFAVLLIDMTNPDFGWIQHDVNPFALGFVVVVAFIGAAGLLLHKKIKE